eukprot:3154677-Prymnesium_polylepis.1
MHFFCPFGGMPLPRHASVVERDHGATVARRSPGRSWRVLNTSTQYSTQHALETALAFETVLPHLNNNLSEAKDRAKHLCHSLDNNGTIYGFYRTYSLPSSGAGHKPPATLNILLGTRFNLQQFIDEKAAQTVWLAQ